ncbi:MAG: rubredoxin [Magnetococcales bacterium]|nr:rubredoxin [Magnetococcales bacterium]
MRQWRCLPCDYVYDEEKGMPDADIAPGTRFDDLPESWRCPNCGVPKEGFEPVDGDMEVIELEGDAW